MLNVTVAVFLLYVAVALYVVAFILWVFQDNDDN